MSLKNDIFTQLQTSEDVTDLISTRIFFGMANPDSFPVVIIETSAEGNTAVNKSDLTRGMVVLTCVGTSHDDAEAVAVACRAALDRQRFGSVISCSFLSQEESAVSNDGDADKITFAQTVSFNVLYTS